MSVYDKIIKWCIQSKLWHSAFIIMSIILNHMCNHLGGYYISTICMWNLYDLINCHKVPAIARVIMNHGSGS